MNVRHNIRKAVIPAAGLGSRFLPATKVIPKELLPVAGRPLIQYAVEEALASGIETVIIVISESKHALGQHFSRDVALENLLRSKGKHEDAELVRRLAELGEIHTVCQRAPLGLADAIRTALPLLGDEPFAVILPDALIDSQTPCIRQLMDCHEQHPGCIVATRMVDAADVGRFGMLDVVPMDGWQCDGRTLRVMSLSERPQAVATTSHYGIFGRYLLEHEIFSAIERTKPGFAGELQLTDALQIYCASSPLYAYQFEGQHYDAGDQLGFLQANLAHGLKDPYLAQPLREYLAAIADSIFAPPAVERNSA